MTANLNGKIVMGCPLRSHGDGSCQECQLRTEKVLKPRRFPTFPTTPYPPISVFPTNAMQLSLEIGLFERKDTAGLHKHPMGFGTGLSLRASLPCTTSVPSTWSHQPVRRYPHSSTVHAGFDPHMTSLQLKQREAIVAPYSSTMKDWCRILLSAFTSFLTGSVVQL